jgi:thiol-disulfide isomerase/thioredoxin
MKTSVILVGILAVLAVLAGCTQTVPQAAMEKSEPAMMEKETAPEAMAKETATETKDAMTDGEWSAEEMAAMEKEHGATMAASGFIDYNKELFDKAQNENKLVVLAFHADWCPSCVAERAAIAEGVKQLPEEKVVVFEVHYKDDKTTDEHNALIKQYQIPYQHTKVVLKDGRMVLKSPKAWTVDEFVAEIQKLL